MFFSVCGLHRQPLQNISLDLGVNKFHPFPSFMYQKLLSAASTVPTAHLCTFSFSLCLHKIPNYFAMKFKVPSSSTWKVSDFGNATDLEEKTPKLRKMPFLVLLAATNEPFLHCWSLLLCSAHTAVCTVTLQSRNDLFI